MCVCIERGEGKVDGQTVRQIDRQTEERKIQPDLLAKVCVRITRHGSYKCDCLDFESVYQLGWLGSEATYHELMSGCVCIHKYTELYAQRLCAFVK